MDNNKFHLKLLHRLNNPDRLKDVPPQFIWDKLNIAESEVVIDVGAGTGFFSIAFLSFMKQGKIFACDISEVMIEWMRNHVYSKYPDIIPVLMDESVVPLDDNIADLVFMIALHHELEDPVKLLKEIHRLLKKKGKLFIVDWKKEEMSNGPPTHIRCSPEDVQRQMEEAGFQKIQIFRELDKHFLFIAEKQALNLFEDLTPVEKNCSNKM